MFVMELQILDIKPEKPIQIVEQSFVSEIGSIDIIPDKLTLSAIQQKLSRDIIVLWYQEPSGNVDKMTLAKWRELGPVNLVDLHCTSPIPFDHNFGFDEIRDALGGYYQGQVNINQQPHGLGRYVSKDGEVYEGQWEFAEENGYGRRILNTGEYYIGMWKDYKFNGFGKFVY